jgi:hypothetical protein
MRASSRQISRVPAMPPEIRGPPTRLYEAHDASFLRQRQGAATIGSHRQPWTGRLMAAPARLTN